jgi:hypothetical protein
MEKYGTYRIFKNKITGEIKTLLIDEEENLEKVASVEWVEIFTEIEVDNDN